MLSSTRWDSCSSRFVARVRAAQLLVVALWLRGTLKQAHGRSALQHKIQLITGTPFGLIRSAQLISLQCNRTPLPRSACARELPAQGRRSLRRQPRVSAKTGSQALEKRQHVLRLQRQRLSSAARIVPTRAVMQTRTPPARAQHSHRRFRKQILSSLQKVLCGLESASTMQVGPRGTPALRQAVRS